jgi:hypothetical protein
VRFIEFCVVVKLTVHLIFILCLYAFYMARIYLTPLHLSIHSGTGRMAHLKSVSRRFKNGFREGSSAVKKVKAESS